VTGFDVQKGYGLLHELRHVKVLTNRKPMRPQQREFLLGNVIG
jgi:hypothetical protein